MIRRSLFGACVVASTLVLGCSSSNDSSQPAAQEGNPNKQAAASSVTTTITAMQVAAKPGAAAADGQSSAQQLQSAAQSMQNLVTPKSGATQQQGLTLESLLHPTAGELVGTCNCTATSCTFQGCGNGTTYTMDGTYSWGGGTIKGSIKYTVKAQGAVAGSGAQVEMQLDTDMKITDTSIDGSISSKGTSTTTYGAYTATSTWDSSVKYNAVTFGKGGGSPTGGSAHVKSTASTTAAGVANTYGGEFDITFPFK